MKFDFSLFEFPLHSAPGEFMLFDGTIGNPGCDNCGICDAFVRTKETKFYYCLHCLADAYQC